MANETSAADSSFSEDPSPMPEAQGQAALLLLESLIHSLLDNGGLTKDQAIEAIDSAMQVKEASIDEHKEDERVSRKSLTLLTSMQNSIQAHSGPYDPSAQARTQQS
ncbi:hypothetical protein [Sphingomonas bacterium]|uniref:hypothetical protein n=1 Tax=Sphingomonas bacterium TaxID=1895847 RepID=UPI0015759BDC|nr:hypothetical protein [Sphingomonas bacterium]